MARGTKPKGLRMTMCAGKSLRIRGRVRNRIRNIDAHPGGDLLGSAAGVPLQPSQTRARRQLLPGSGADSRKRMRGAVSPTGPASNNVLANSMLSHEPNLYDPKNGVGYNWKRQCRDRRGDRLPHEPRAQFQGMAMRAAVGRSLESSRSRNVGVE
jgi:hypothetical protein